MTHTAALLVPQSKSVEEGMRGKNNHYDWENVRGAQKKKVLGIFTG